MKTKRNSRIIGAALAAILSIPVATQVVIDDDMQASFRRLDTQINAESARAVRNRALNDRSALRQRRRAYTDAAEKCRDARRTDPNAECPNINDPTTYGGERVHKAGPGSGPVPVESDAPKSVRPKAESRTTTRPYEENYERHQERSLSTHDRLLLRKYIRAGYCSKKAGDRVYKLCVEQLGPESRHGSAPVGLINDNMQLHSMNRSAVPSIKLRLRMLDQAVSGSLGRRTDGPQRVQFEGRVAR